MSVRHPQTNKPIPLLKAVRGIMDAMAIPHKGLKISDKPGKKLMVLLPVKGKDKWVHFGSSTSTTYIEKQDDKKRDRYLSRHSKVYKSDGKTRAIDVLYSPAWLSWHVLWLGPSSGSFQSFS